MSFENILKKLLENAIFAFNSSNYEGMDHFFIKDVELFVPKIKNDKIYTPAIHIKGRKNLYAYWKSVNSKYDNEVTDVDFLTIGKISHIRCTYGKVDLIMDLQIFFDEYGKATKLVHLLPE